MLITRFCRHGWELQCTRSLFISPCLSLLLSVSLLLSFCLYLLLLSRCVCCCLSLFRLSVSIAVWLSVALCLCCCLFVSVAGSLSLLLALCLCCCLFVSVAVCLCCCLFSLLLSPCLCCCLCVSVAVPLSARVVSPPTLCLCLSCIHPHALTLQLLLVIGFIHVCYISTYSILCSTSFHHRQRTTPVAHVDKTSEFGPVMPVHIPNTTGRGTHAASSSVDREGG